MARRIGLLSVSLTALGLAVAGYFVQGAGARSTPVEVADFGVSPSAVADISGGDEYDTYQDSLDMLHPAKSTVKPACAEGAGFSLVKVTDEVAILCKGDEVLGYLVSADGGETKLIETLPSADDCPSKKDDDLPDA